MEAFAGKHSYEPRDGHGLAHDPFNAIVAPRPIGWIGSRSADGVANLAPYSFFNALAYRPPTIGFCSGGDKDSLRNIRATRVFSWSLVTRALAEAMNASSAELPPEADEFALAGLTPVQGRLVDAPMVAESPVAFECRTSDIVQLRQANGTPMNNWFVIGEVVAVHIDAALVAGGTYATAAARPIVRGGGPGDYFEIGESARFVMPRPRSR